ncbi:hypothetical protein ACH4NF_17600 [Streptomyces sp. NPDC017248]|uniref:hypothetical protein n=1 Tax=unclassified Streptomyces TaxID=2593676 RepID=UPI0037A3EE48
MSVRALPPIPADRVARSAGRAGGAPPAAPRGAPDPARDRWYLDPAGRLCAGALLAAAQGERLPPAGRTGAQPRTPADRSYRLLGGDLTFHGPLPEPGQALRCETRLEDSTEYAGVPLLSFRSDVRVDGELRLSVRHGQAGLFTERERATARGTLWTPRPGPARPAGPFALPPTACRASSFSPAQVRAYADGRLAECFGAGWERAAAHVRGPRLSTRHGLLFEEVTDFDPRGGPLGRGYLRATLRLVPGRWYFTGDDPGDPYLPPALLLEGCLQAAAFHLSALGVTTDRDGWRFQPACCERQSVSFRAQATPRHRELVYEVFVTGVRAGPVPRIRADVLCSVDGVRVCHAAGLTLDLVRDRLLGDRGHPVPALRPAAPDPRAAVADGPAPDRQGRLVRSPGRHRVTGGPDCGRPDPPARPARAPAPPFPVLPRVRALGATKAQPRKGSWVEMEYDVTGGPGAHDGAPSPSMAALTEIALQPCGWLARYTGCFPGRAQDLLLRNLGGRAALLRTGGPAPRRVRAKATLTDWADDGTTFLLRYDIECRADDEEEPFLTLSGTFGCLPPAAADGPAGLSPSRAERRHRDAPRTRTVDLASRPQRFFTGPLRLPVPGLLLDRLTGYRPPDDTGPGRIRGEAEIRAGVWFRPARPAQDPVPPGPLGIEAMYQLLRAYAVERDLAAGLRAARCAPAAAGTPLTWTSPGRISPGSRLITAEVEITAEGEDLRGRYLEARGVLWADDTLVLRVDGLALRISPRPPRPGGALGAHLTGGVLDPARDTWLADHRPALTTPSVPLMHVVRIVAETAERVTGRRPGRIRDLTVRRWIVADTPVRYVTETRRERHGTRIDLLTLPTGDDTAEPTLVATGTALPSGPDRPAPLPPLTGARPVDRLPYDGTTPALFHGAAFHYLRGMRTGARGADGVLDPRRGSVPPAPHHSGLLDAALHVIPHHALWTWDENLPRAVLAYPYRLDALDLYEPLPGPAPLRVAARLADSDDLPAGSFVRVTVQLYRRRTLVADLRLTVALVPAGFLGRAGHPARMAFLRDRAYAAGLGVSRTSRDGVTHLTAADLSRSDWYPGLVGDLYGLTGPVTGLPERLARIAVRDHAARLLRTHPSRIETAPDLTRAWAAGRPREAVKVWVRPEGTSVAVGTLAAPGGTA